MINWLDRLTCYDRLIIWLDDEHCLMIKTAWWWKRFDKNDLMKTTWWKRLDDEDDLMMKTKRFSDENEFKQRLKLFILSYLI